MSTNRKIINRSTQRALQQKNINPRISYQRKCQTPSIINQVKKSKSKPKQQYFDKKLKNQSKNIKYSQSLLSNHYTTIKKQSPFKHKNKPYGNQLRHAKNIEHQLSNLNQSAFYDSIKEASAKKGKSQTIITKTINQGKQFMKNNQFQKGLSILSHLTTRNPCNLQANYLMGVCSFHLQQYDKAIKTFTLLLNEDPEYRKNAYLFLAISQKKRNQNEQALITLTNALQYFPNYFDALVLRAKILSKLHRYYDSLQDLNKSLKIEPKNIQSLVAKADCLRSLNQHADAIKIYCQILQNGWDGQVVLKRAIAYIENQQLHQALKDLNGLIKRNPLNSQSYLFKGLAYAKMKNYNEAILAYEQAIKYNSSKKATTKALYQVSKLKIQIGDYYGASYTLQRSNSMEIDIKVIQKLKIFTEAATSIMKKKYKKGIQNLNYLTKKQHINEQIKPLLYSFRAYAYFCQYKFLNALNDLNHLQKIGFILDNASKYNYYLLQGISSTQNNNFSSAITSFNSAQQIRNDFSDPLIYKCLIKIAQYNRNPKTKDKQLLNEALKYIQKSFQREDNYNSHYLCSVILYTIGNFQQAFQHIQKAIQKSDDHVIKHFYLRALINGVIGKIKEAYVDFSNVLNLGKQLKQKSQIQQGQKQKQILQAYLNRAKCYLLFGEKKKAFQDLQTYISFKPLDSEIHTVAGRLLFSIGACQDAIKAYNYSPNIDKKRQQLLQRSKCYLILKELNLCLKDLQKCIQLGDNYAKFDYCCLSSLKQASKCSIQSYKESLTKLSLAEGFNTQKGHIFYQSDLYFYKGVYNFYLGAYSQAQKLFIKSKNLKSINRQLQLLQQQDPDKFDSELFENKIYTDAQIDYNIAVCQLMNGHLEAAKKYLIKYQSFDLLFSQNDIDQPIDLTPFPTANRLCSIFPQVQYPKNPYIKVRLSFCLPKVLPPQIKFQIQPKIIQQLQMSSTEPRPDAPWIKRNTFGVVFTDQMMGTDIDIKTQISAKKVQQIKIQVQQQQKQYSNKKQNKNLKDMFALDDEVQKKLARLMKKQKNK